MWGREGTERHHGRIAVPDGTEAQVDVKTVARTAKNYVTDLFADEEITNVGLEEVEFDEGQDRWIVTVGFSRPWDQRNALTAALGEGSPGRSYKVLQIADTDGCVLSLKDRLLGDRN